MNIETRDREKERTPVKMLRMGVDPAGLAFGLDKMSHELHPQQYLRELTQNGIEAIQRTPRGVGEVVWDAMIIPLGGSEAEKLCCIDNGVGMTHEEMIDYINTGFRSGKDQNHQGNFGIGAKVAGLTFNKAGLLYVSWKDGRGSMVHLIQDPSTGEYGLKQLERADGTFGFWAPVSDAFRPPQIDRHGTMVVLLGNNESDDTFTPPKETDLPPSTWVGSYLTSRYFDLPEGIAVRARQNFLTRREGGSSYRALVMVRPQAEALDTNSMARGVVELSGARAYWWLMEGNEGGTRAKNAMSGYNNVRGHIAALYDGELYEMLTLRKGGTARLQNFGVIVGTGRVVIYVEPRRDGEAIVEPNLTRTRLLMDREPLPWSRWAGEFADNMPEEISAMMDGMFSGGPGGDYDTAIRKRLSKIRELLDLHRWSPSPDGIEKAVEATEGGVPRQLGNEQPGNSGGGGSGGLSAAIYRLLRSEDGEAAVKKQTKSRYPKVIWISSRYPDLPNRESEDLEGRAARYIPTTNRIIANADFVGFEQMADYLGRELHVPSGLIRQFAQIEYETVLIETVMSMLSLEGTKEWSEEEVRQALSEESLTAAVMSRFHILQVVRKDAIRKAREGQKERKTA